MIKIELKSFDTDLANPSAEYNAASVLKDKLEEDLSHYPDAKGTIYIQTNIRIFGQKRDDIDILIMGFLDNYKIKNVRTKNCGVVDELNIKSFICNVELKAHPAEKVKRQGTSYIVYYKGVPSDASEQCREAKFSLRNYLIDQLSIRTFISDILWFKGLSKQDLRRMRDNSIDNALPSGFDFRDLIDTILLQTEVRKDEIGQVNLDTFANGENDYKLIEESFTRKREPQGLTRGKFELISQRNVDIERLVQNAGQKLTIVTGRAGTGKTIQLLQVAFTLASQDYASRCMILTYNHALVSDIKRLIDYTPMPSKVDGRTVSIKTIHSFFQSLMKEVGISTSKLIPSSYSYEDDYNDALKDLYKFVVDECEKEDIESLKDMSESYIDWDYILIDEAQDFSDIEKKILFKVYGANRLIVADGVDQFMRSDCRQIWEKGVDKDMVLKPKTMELERRQKNNLVTFVNAFAKRANLEWKVRPNDDLPGGEVKIYSKFPKEVYYDLKDNCDKNNCENYDILLLMPPSSVKEENGNRSFNLAKTYEKLQIPIFDGIDNKKRTTYPTKDQCRIYQYDSCRGLEGWCVVCAKFDELIQYKMDTYIPNCDELGFDPEIIKKRNVYLWSLMPLTRPIDTLVITLNNPDSEVGKMLKELADTYKDFVEWNIE